MVLLLPSKTVSHTQEIVPPAEAITFALYSHNNKTRLALVASRWLTYYAELQQHLSVNATSLSEDIVSAFTRLYNTEASRFMSIVAEAASLTAATAASSAAAAGAAATVTTTAMHQGDGSHNNNIKANLPSKFNGRTEDLDLFLDSMATYYAVMNIPADKQAGILRLNLSGNVHLTLTNTHKSNPTFWENPDDIITALKQLYQRPNKCATAQAALKKLNMAGYRLSTYFTKFVSLAGQAEYNTDDAFVKTAFCQGLNNLASRGGLRTQIMPLLKDPNKTLNDIYAEADSIMRNDHGDDFNSKTCAADADEHHIGIAAANFSSKYYQQPQRQQSQQQSGWTTVDNKRNKRGYNNNNNIGNNNNNKRPKFEDKNVHNLNLNCTRCHRNGHDVATCNAATDNKGKPLSITTAANTLKGFWTKGYYPQKKTNRGNDKVAVSQSHNVNAAAADTNNNTPMLSSDDIDNIKQTTVEAITDHVASFGITSVGERTFCDAAKQSGGAQPKGGRPSSAKKCK